MIMAHLITGYAGEEHIQSADDGAFNASFFGEGQFVMEQGNQFEASIINNNTIRVLDGNGLMYGRHFRINPNTYEDLTITTGTAGTNRIDLIVMTYKKDSNEGTESCYLEVIKGTEASVNPQVPSYTNGNILEGATVNQMPMFKVTIEGVVLANVETLFTTIPTYKALAEQYEEEFKEACQTHLGSLNILDSIEEIEANEQSNQLAGALGVKEGFEEINSDIETLNNNLVTLDGTPFVFDYQDGKFGFNTSETRGADTFTPFKSGGNDVWDFLINGANAIYEQPVMIASDGGLWMSSHISGYNRKFTFEYEDEEYELTLLTPNSSPQFTFNKGTWEVTHIKTNSTEIDVTKTATPNTTVTFSSNYGFFLIKFVE